MNIMGLSNLENQEEDIICIWSAILQNQGGLQDDYSLHFFLFPFLFLAIKGKS